MTDLSTKVDAPATQRHEVVAWLRNTRNLLVEIQAQEFWRTVVSPDTHPQLIVCVMRELYREIAAYQPHVIEAAIAAIAQMPRSLKPRLLKAMLAHQADEFDHGEMASRDFVALGGSAAAGFNEPMSPEAFAVAAVWWMIAYQREPFAYLGALYLFEGLTLKVATPVKGNLRAKGFTQDSLEYIEFHSTEDVKHANLVKYLISEVADAYPGSVGPIRNGFERFRSVYPIPLWSAAFQRAKVGITL